jgi:tetratricopeptide (TPR) repeat protein
LAAGVALEALPERKRAGRTGELAWQFLQGDDAERALRYSLQAGDEAAAVFAHREAETHYRTALELARELGDEQQEADALERLAGKLHALGRYDEALEALERASVMREKASDDEAERRIVAQIGWLHTFRATPAAGIERVQRLLARADEGRPSTGLAGCTQPWRTFSMR